jgi:hypothetical protein
VIDERLVLFGALLNLIGSGTYALATLKGRTKPNRVTWFLWALAPLIAFSASVKDGVGLPSLMTFMVGFGPLLIFLSSFVNRKAYWRISRLDIICGTISVIAIILWLITGSGFIAILFSIIADLIAGIPTLIKAYNAPETENYSVFLFGSISAAITLLAIDKWEFSYYAFPVYILTICLILFVLIKFPRLRTATSSS